MLAWYVVERKILMYLGVRIWFNSFNNDRAIRTWLVFFRHIWVNSQLVSWLLLTVIPYHILSLDLLFHVVICNIRHKTEIQLLSWHLWNWGSLKWPNFRAHGWHQLNIQLSSGIMMLGSGTKPQVRLCAQCGTLLRFSLSLPLWPVPHPHSSTCSLSLFLSLK